MLFLALQEVVKQSKHKTRLLEQHATDIEEVTQLREELKQQKALSLKLLERLDANAARYHNKIQKLTTKNDEVVGKDKSLHLKNKGNVPSEIIIDYICSCALYLISSLDLLQS
jgi:urocanate hydratase